MPKKKEKERTEAHFMPDKWNELKELAEKQNRSIKNLVETIVLNYLEIERKKNNEPDS